MAEVEGDATGECADGIDNDEDGQADCADPGCIGNAECDAGGGSFPAGTNPNGTNGTNPNPSGTNTTADSDGDGWTDGEEFAGNTDPNDAKDHPYTGGWPIDACRDSITATGDNVGDIANDFLLYDQHGELVRLHDFCDQAVLLVSSAEWCGPCRAEAPEVAGWHDEHRDDGLMVITLLSEDNYGQSPNRGVLDDWASSYGIDHAVVADSNWDVTVRFTGFSIAIPTMHLIGPGMEILATDSYLSESQIVGALP